MNTPVLERLHQVLQRGAAINANAVAVEDPERSVEITYAELDARSRAVMQRLIAYGVRPGDRVGILAPKSIGVVTAIFGILRAGAAYVPADPLSPISRCALIFGNCDVRAVVVDAARADELRGAWGGVQPLAVTPLTELSDLGVELLLVTAEGVASRAEPVTWAVPGGPGDLAYILYTSGSTGLPKGVVHTHASALSFVNWCSETFEPRSSDRFSSHAPFHFDLSILDIYVPLKHGARLVLIGEEAGKQPLRLAPLIAERAITVWYSTPSILRMLTEFGRMEQYDYSSLRLVLFAGEVFPVKHLRALQRLWRGPRYFNLYGPTETNVCTYFEVPGMVPEDRTVPYPIGVTCSNDLSRVVDADGNDVAPGEEGELLIAGGSVMKEYWQDPARTAAAFVEYAGRRWYRTGDIVRDSGGGVYEFAGRRDRMVKRRGYRVELGEIESALYHHPQVEEAAVVAVPDEENGVRIHAFLSLANGAQGSLIEMKRFLTGHLPQYMIPDRFVFLPSLPKTSTAKTDLEALKAAL